HPVFFVACFFGRKKVIYLDERGERKGPEAHQRLTNRRQRGFKMGLVEKADDMSRGAIPQN
ncbi:MAG: hypothetical protein J4O09_16650, partial [Chloroflexi bacterium]|nr:hypothetical protein [Chloroflexota bacterium]